MKILVAEDHPIFRKGLLDILSERLPKTILIEAENGLKALESIIDTKPDIAFLDVDMPGMNGLKVCSEAKEKKSPCKIIILTMHKSQEVFNTVLHVGADGFLLKDNSAKEIIDCIEAVAKGERYISPSMQLSINEIASFREKKNNILSGFSTLTKTEKKVLQMVSRNLSSKEIALRLFVTPKSAENYRSRICKKLNIESENNSLLRWTMENKDLLKLLAFDM